MAQDRARRSDARSFIQTSLLKSQMPVSAGAFPFFFIVFDCSIFYIKKLSDSFSQIRPLFQRALAELASEFGTSGTDMRNQLKSLQLNYGLVIKI